MFLLCQFCIPITPFYYHCKLLFNIVLLVRTNGANGKHQWCEYLAPMVRMLNTNSAENKTPYNLLLVLKQLTPKSNYDYPFR